MSSSQHDTPPESTPDRSFAEKDDQAPQSPVSSSQVQYQYQLSSAEDSFVSVEDSDDQQLTGAAGDEAASAAAKRKRRRTQHPDKVILENAFARDSKPGKEARQAIAKLVTMNEKQVQIWFQNRRQNCRRKERPLSAEELAGLARTSHAPLPQPIPNAAHPVSDPAPVASATSSPLPHPATSTSISLNPQSTNPSPAHGHVRSFSDAPQATPWQSTRGGLLDASPSLPTALSFGSHSSSHSFSGSVGWIANRNLGSSMSSFAQTPNNKGESSRLSFSQTTPPSSQDSQSRSETRSENPSSSVRLRRSLDGQAQLVPADSSPGSEDASPGLIARAPRVLQRSHTDIGSVCLPSFSTLTKDLPSPIQPSHPVPRLSRGRSRDVQAWESCADADAPDELTALAERESSGSAIAAISMIRYTNVLQPSGPGKRNASVSRGSQSALHPAKKSKLSRTTSSLARLETPSSSPFLAENIDKARLEKIAVTTLLGSPTDSDKENLTPDEDGEATQQQQTTGRHRRRRPLPSAANGPPRSPRPQGGILHISAGSHLDLTHHKTAAAKTSFRRRGAARGDADVAIFEDHESEAADSSSGRQTPVDVARMARAQVSPSKTVEADCVAGLLSLSQGQWR